MTLLPVLGTALIAANKLDAKNSVKGSILTVATPNAVRISPTFQRKEAADDSCFTIIDWIHVDHRLID